MTQKTKDKRRKTISWGPDQEGRASFLFSFLFSLFSSRRRGFTLLEIVVAIGIMTMLALLYAANFRGYQQGLAVQSDADRIAGSIRQAQIWALTGELVNGSRPDGGYGIYIPAACTSGVCAFTVFANSLNPASYTYDNDGDCSNGGCDTIIRTENLTDAVNVSNATPAGPLTLIFIPPSAECYANNVKSASATITLAHRHQTAKTAIIAIDGVSGQVNVQ